jgi:SHAQKYF class myb-like DNA-binding protein
MFNSYWVQNYNLVIRNDLEEAQKERATIGRKKGPWSTDEHDAFAEGYEKLGRNWRKIMQEYVPTGTNLQIRSHKP